VQSSVYSKKLYEDVSESMNGGKIQNAVDLCSETRGPVAGVFHAALSRYDRGLEEVEKAMENAGSLEMAFLEKNMIWLNTVITVAPMIGFTGTVVGMIGAFDAIKAANDISPAVVAGGISQALLTTAFGLIVAMIIQFFQNFFVSRIDQLILDMEENSVRLLDSMHAKKK
jgi:biopolymer transport protein ExbB